MKVHVLQAVVEFENEVGATSSDKYIQVGVWQQDICCSALSTCSSFLRVLAFLLAVEHVLLASFPAVL